MDINGTFPSEERGKQLRSSPDGAGSHSSYVCTPGEVPLLCYLMGFLESLIILGHLGLWFQKMFQKSFKFETQPQIEDRRLKIAGKVLLESSIFNLQFEVEFQI